MPDYDAKVDYYELLQVHPRASTAVIKAAHRVILRELRAHPDLGGRTDGAGLLNEACRVLPDPESRSAYDGERLIVTAQSGDAPAAEQPVACPRCRAPNAVVLGSDLRNVECSRCRETLAETAPTEPEEKRENVFRLPAEQYRRLCLNSQVDRRAPSAVLGESLRCRFCGNDWAQRKPGKPISACPACLRTNRYASRLLK